MNLFLECYNTKATNDNEEMIIFLLRRAHMRLRNIPGADEAIACSPFCIQKPDAYRGIWNSIFNNQNEIHIEIGMGKEIGRAHV